MPDYQGKYTGAEIEDILGKIKTDGDGDNVLSDNGQYVPLAYKSIDFGDNADNILSAFRSLFEMSSPSDEEKTLAISTLNSIGHGLFVANNDNMVVYIDNRIYAVERIAYIRIDIYLGPNMPIIYKWEYNVFYDENALLMVSNQTMNGDYYIPSNKSETLSDFINSFPDIWHNYNDAFDSAHYVSLINETSTAHIYVSKGFYGEIITLICENDKYEYLYHYSDNEWKFLYNTDTSYGVKISTINNNTSLTMTKDEIVNIKPYPLLQDDTLNVTLEFIRNVQGMEPHVLTICGFEQQDGEYPSDNIQKIEISREIYIAKNNSETKPDIVVEGPFVFKSGTTTFKDPIMFRCYPNGCMERIYAV